MLNPPKGRQAGRQARGALAKQRQMKAGPENNHDRRDNHREMRE